jgi:hypothetical protein
VRTLLEIQGATDVDNGESLAPGEICVRPRDAEDAVVAAERQCAALQCGIQGLRITGSGASGPSRSQVPGTCAFERQGFPRAVARRARARATWSRAWAVVIRVSSPARSRATATRCIDSSMSIRSSRGPELRQVAPDRDRRAPAFRSWHPVVAARARVRGEDELEVSREDRAEARSMDLDAAGLERLA